MTKLQAQEQLEAKDRLLDVYGIKPGDTIYTVIRHVSDSGMSRNISVLHITDDKPRELDYMVAKLLQAKVSSHHGGILVRGCGMDMGADLVYSLSRVLFKDNFICTGKGCFSNDHNNPGPDKDNYTPHTHSDGGYALWHRWI